MYFNLKYAIPNVIKILFLTIVDAAVFVIVCLRAFLRHTRLFLTNLACLTGIVFDFVSLTYNVAIPS